MFFWLLRSPVFVFQFSVVMLGFLGGIGIWVLARARLTKSRLSSRSSNRGLGIFGRMIAPSGSALQRRKSSSATRLNSLGFGTRCHPSTPERSTKAIKKALKRAKSKQVVEGHPHPLRGEPCSQRETKVDRLKNRRHTNPLIFTSNLAPKD
mgnify:CR=1 FL=1